MDDLELSTQPDNPSCAEISLRKPNVPGMRRFVHVCLYCDRSPVAFGLCTLHWRRWRERRTMEAPYRAQRGATHRHLTPAGYVMLHDRRGVPFKMEHRDVMEHVLGRKLLPSEIVHHINGIRTDNRPQNLRVMIRGDHSRLHNPTRVPLCHLCGQLGFALGLCRRHYNTQWRRNKRTEQRALEA